MYAVTRVLEGLLVAHVMWALFFVTGTMLDARKERVAGTWSDALLRLVLFSAAGMAIWGFEGFALGLLHGFTLAGLTVALLANVAVFAFVRGERPWAGAFWARRSRALARAARGPGAIVYVAALVLSVPAVIPDFSYDGVKFHLAYAYEWFRADHIFADPRMRFPYYAFNTEVLDTLMMVARAGRFVTFLSWLSGTLTALGVAAVLARLDAGAQTQRSPLERRAAGAVYAIIPFSLMLSAVFLRWWPTAMTDVTAALMFTTFATALSENALDFDGTWLRTALVCAAFLAGIKPSYLLFVPFVALALLITARRYGIARRTIALLLGSLLLLSSAWYLRNLIEDGDPVPPVFNLLLHGTDRYITAADWARVSADYAPPRTLAQWLRYPVDDFFDTQSSLFREYGVTAVVFFLYGIVIAAPVLLARRARSPSQAAVASLFGWTALGLIYLIGVSALTRYSLLIYPCVAVCAGTFILDAAALVPRGVLFAPFAALLTVIPTPASHEFYHEFYGVYYAGLQQILPDDQTALSRFVPGYPETYPIFGTPIIERYPTVLLIEAPINYYVEMHDAQPLGDYAGIGRYADFAAAVDAGDARRYLDARAIGAIVVNRSVHLLVPDEIAYLRRQIVPAGWRELPSSDAQFTVFLR